MNALKQVTHPNCTVNNCAKVSVARLLCRSHYNQAWKIGLPDLIKDRRYREAAVCSFATCGQQAKARGMCPTHWRRWRLYGDPALINAKCLMSLDERFWSKVVPADVKQCWPWNAGRSTGGYGIFHVSGRQVMAHRYAYEHLIAAIPEGLQLDHLCRNRCCVNPWHLEPVTARVNTLRNTGPSAANATKTHCPAGHCYDESNTREKGRRRVCRACVRIAATARREAVS